MTLQQIRYVLAILKYGSISKAAQEICIAQPHLSSTLKDLEKELGITIFSRTRKGVELTAEGKEFLSFAKPLLAQEEKILELYSRNTLKPAFNFSLSTQRYPFVIKAFFELFHRYAPGQYEIHLREVNMRNVINDVFNGKSDIGIIFLSNTTEGFMRRYLAAKGLEFHLIKEITPCVFFKKDHPMAAKAAVTLGEMSQFPFASFESETSASPEFSEEVFFYNFSTAKKNFIVVDRATMINVLTHTEAFSIGTGILTSGFAGPELVSRPIKGHEKEIKLGWIHHMDCSPNEIFCEFIEMVEAVLEKC